MLRATHTDEGAPPAAALVGEAVHLLQPRRKEAEYHTSRSGTSNAPTGDVDGNLEVAGIDHGDFIGFSPVNLTNIVALTFRVAANNSGAQIEVRRDSPTGTLLATSPIPDSSGAYTNVTVPITDPGGTHGLFLVFVRSPGDNDLLRLNWLRFEGNGINLSVPLSIAPNGTGFVISFLGSGTLEYADGVSGPWQPVDPPALSPYAITPEAAARFYRLRWP